EQVEGNRGERIDVQPAAFPQTRAPILTAGGPRAARATVGVIGGRGNADEMHRATACVERTRDADAAVAADAGRVSALAALAALGSIGSQRSTGQSDGAITDVQSAPQPLGAVTAGAARATRATVGAIGGRGNADEINRATAC